MPWCTGRLLAATSCENTTASFKHSDRLSIFRISACWIALPSLRARPRPDPNGDPRRLHAIMNSMHGNQGGSRTRIHDDITKVIKQCAKSCEGMIAELEVRHRPNYDHGGPARPDLILNDVGPSTLTDRRDHPNGIAVNVVTAHPIHSDGHVSKATARTKDKAAADAFNAEVRKYGGAPEREGMEFLPFALDTFGLLHIWGDSVTRGTTWHSYDGLTSVVRVSYRTLTFSLGYSERLAHGELEVFSRFVVPFWDR